MLQPKKSTFLQDLKKYEDQLIKDGKIENPDILEEQLGGIPEKVSSIDYIYPNKNPEYFENFEEYMPTQTVRSGQYSLDQLSKIRAQNQSNLEQFGNATVRFSLNTIPSIISGFASMLDIPGYFDAEHAATNSIVNAVEEWKQKVNQEIAPIYLENPDTLMDFGDWAWWMDRGEGLTESVASFLAQGYGMGAIMKGVSTLANIRKIHSLIGMSAQTQKTVGNITGTLANAIALNQSEAVLEATDVYNSTKQYWLDKGYSMEDAKKQAAIGASTTMNMNRANILLNLTSANMFMSPLKQARQLLNPISRMNTLKHLVGEGSQEALEELINHTASQAGRAHGAGKDYTIDDAFRDMSSAEGMEAALLGAIGGIAQTGGATAFKHSKYGTGSAVNPETGVRESYITQQKSRYQEQQKIIEELKASGVKGFGTFDTLVDVIKKQQQMNDALAEGNVEKFQQLQAETFEARALQSFKAGTAQVFEDLIRASENEEEGITKEKIEQKIADFRELEKVYRNYEGYENVTDLFYNRANKIRTEQMLRDQQFDLANANINLESKAKEIAKKYKFKRPKDVIYKQNGEEKSRTTRITEEPITYSLNDLQNNPGDTQENQDIYNAFVNELTETNAYKEHSALQQKYDTTEELMNHINDEFITLKSEKAQQEARTKNEEKAVDRERLSKIRRDDFKDLDELRKIEQESNDPIVKQEASKKIKDIETARKVADQKKKDDALYNKYAYDIATADATPEGKAKVDKIKSEIANSKNISPDLKKRLADEIEKYENNYANGMMSDSKVTRPNDADIDSAKVNEIVVDSKLPEDFVSNNAEENIEQEIADAVSELAKQENKGEINEEGKLEYDFNRSAEGHNKGAYSAREMIQKEFDGKVTREDIDNELNTINPDILNPKKLNEGSKITIKVDEDYDGDVYVGETKEKKPWVERRKEIANDPDTYRDEVPMVIIDNATGKPIFYVHDINWINESNVYGDVEADRAALRAIRDKVLESGPNGVETSITSKSAGILFTTANGETIAVNEAMPDSNLKLAIGKEGAFTDNSIDASKLLNKKINDGQLYAIVPIGKDQIAIPLHRTTLGTGAVYNTIVKAIESYLNPDENEEFINSVLNHAQGDQLDLRELSDLRRFIAQYVYLYPLSPNQNLKDVVANSSEKFNRENSIITITGNTIEFGKPGVSETWGSISENTPENMLPILLSKLKHVLKTVKVHADKNNIAENKNVIILNEEGQPVSKSYRNFVGENFKTNVLSTNIGTEDNPNYVYSIQQNITYDTSFAPVEKKPIVTTTSVQDDVEVIVVDDALQQELNNAVQEIARKTTEYPNERIVEELDDLRNNRLQKFTTGLNEKPSAEQVEQMIYVYENVLAIRRNQNDVKDVKIDDREIDVETDDADDDYTDYLPLTEESKSAINKALDDLSIVGLNPREQESVIAYVGNKLIRQAVENKKAESVKVFSEFKQQLEKQLALYKEKGLPNKARKIQSILNQFDKVRLFTKQQIELMGTGKISDESIDNVEESTGGLERTVHSDEWTFTLDSKSTASANLKKFLTFVENKEDGLTKYDNLGFPEIIPFDVVYNTLHEILAGLPSDYQLMEDTISAYTSKFPWLQTVLERLDDASEQVKNEFVSDMTKHGITMKFVTWKKLQNGNYILMSQDANSSSTQKRLMNQWSYNITDTNNQYSILTVDENNDYVFDKEKAQAIIDKADEWSKADEKDLPDAIQLKNWLYSFGIIVDDRTIADLQKGKFKNKGNITYPRLFSNSNGLVNVLASELKKNLDGKFDDSKILNDTVVKSLAIMDSGYAANVFSNSFNAGGKTIYTFTNNKYVVNRVRELKENKQLLKDLSEVPFIKNSLWLDDLINNTDFNDQFSIDYLSLEALKEQHKASKDNRKLNNLSDDEHEVIKLAMFFNNYGTTRRKVSFFYPTMSDKTTMMVVNALSRNIKVINGELSEPNYKTLYESVVLPEIQRMTSEKATGVKGYNPNLFYFLPVLNTKTVTIDGSEKTIVQHVIDGKGNIDTELRDAIMVELKSTFKELIDEKIEEWVKLGIGKNNAFLNSTYMTGVAQGSGKVESGELVSGKVKYAAMDYVFNSLIANAEMYKLTIGDPALYYKKGNSVEQAIEETYTNIGKRLAADIAPGIELADAENNEYHQIFLDDKKLKSKAYENKIFDIVSENVKEKYSKIEGSDAQEYTTWKEHLYVLKQLGRISNKQYSELSTKLKNNEELEYKELQVVLQPIKPVYVGNVLQKNLDRRIYIKSSSFPLIPQLTSGLELDTLRRKMEEFETKNNTTVRAAFGTAVKVGNVENSIKLFNDNGDVNEFEILDENVLKLPRKNFRIQQDVPYDYEKEAINIGTQERKLLFNNILSVNGFKLDGQSKTGKQLNDIYVDTYKQLFEYKQKQLKKELGLIEEISEEINPSELLTKRESSTFTALEEMQNKLKEATSPIAKSKIKNTVKDELGTKTFARAEYVNKNFDKIIEKLLDAKVNVFFDDNFNKKCD